MSEKDTKLRDDPLSAVISHDERIELLEAQVAALMRLADANLPPGTARAWPRRPTPPTKGTTP